MSEKVVAPYGKLSQKTFTIPDHLLPDRKRVGVWKTIPFKGFIDVNMGSEHGT